MLSHDRSIATFRPSNIVIWMTMAFQGGYLNMVALMSCGKFVSHLTRYATLLPKFVVSENTVEFSLCLFIPAAFVTGAIFSAFLVDSRLIRERSPKYWVAFGSMSLCLAGLLGLGLRGAFGTFGEGLIEAHDFLFLSALAFICGLQNASITSISGSIIRTTHLSGIATDLGIGIVRLWTLKISRPDSVPSFIQI